MVQNISIIKWSNSFPGIIAIVYRENPTMVCLCNFASLDKPGEFHRRDPNREHGSIQYFNDSVVCMEWGYGIYKNHLALGLANGDVVVRLCRDGIFTEGEVCRKTHDTQSLRCISLNWRRSMNHIAIGLLRDEKTYCIDIYDVQNHSMVIPTICTTRVLHSLHWIDRKGSYSARTSPKSGYRGLMTPRERFDIAPDFLLAAFDNYIQVFSINSSSHQLLYSLSVVYKCIATMNSRVAFVNDNPAPAAGTLANYSTAPEIPFPAYSYSTPSQNQVQIQIQSQNATQSPSQNPNPSPIQLQSPVPVPVQLQTSVPGQLSNPTPNPSPIQSQISFSSPSPSPLQTQSPLQSQPSFPPLLQSQSQPGPQSQSKSKSKTQSHRHNLTELEFESILPYRATRTMSLDYRDTVNSSRKKDATADSSLLLKTSIEKKNSAVYDVDSNGKLEPVAFFSQPSANVIYIDWFSKQELFVADAYQYWIINVTNGKASQCAFPGGKVVQCAIDKMEHPIITRILTYMSGNQSVSWTYLTQVMYRSISFVNHHRLCITNGKNQIECVETQDEIKDDIYDVMIQRCKQKYSTDVTKNMEIFAEQYHSTHSNENTELFFFWCLYHSISALDEENLSAGSMVSDPFQAVKNSHEACWMDTGLFAIFKNFSSDSQEERCGRIIVYKAEEKERILKKVLEAYSMYQGKYKSDCFRHVLILVVQCKFEEAIQFINYYISSLVNSKQNDSISTVIDRLLVLCNILTAVLSLKGDTKLLASNIELQLNHFSKTASQTISKTLQFLLLYLRYETDVNPYRVKENDNLIQEYLNITSNRKLLSIEDIIVVLRYMSPSFFIDYLCNIVNQLVAKGYLVGLPLVGMNSPSMQTLLQNYVNRTGDVQTVTILSLLQKSVYNFSRYWIQYYFDLLDHAELFTERCEIENLFYSFYKEDVRFVEKLSERCVPGVIVCPKCHAKIIPHSPNAMTRKAQSASMPVCQVCRQPLFTCSLCALPVYQKSSDWMVWCYSCHHGGHYSHITNWFKTHSECPVNDCTCHCAEI